MYRYRHCWPVYQLQPQTLEACWLVVTAVVAVHDTVFMKPEQHFPEHQLNGWEKHTKNGAKKTHSAPTRHPLSPHPTKDEPAELVWGSHVFGVARTPGRGATTAGILAIGG